MSGHEVHNIQSPVFPECPLFWILRPESFKRRVDNSHQEHIQQEPVQANCSPLRRLGLICTLDPPQAVAAIASNIPVRAKTFFSRRIEETIANMTAAAIRNWIKIRMACIG